MKEIWKIIPETNEQYSVSNLGRLKANYINVRTRGKLVRVDRERILAQNKKGYQCCPTGYTHRVIASLFVDNPKNYDQVHHIDGDVHNNRADNLMWVDSITHNRIHFKGKPFTEEHKKKLSGPNPKKGRPGELNGRWKPELHI